MDVETAAAIGDLAERVDALELSLRTEIGSVRNEVGSVRNEVGSLRNEMTVGFATMRREMATKQELREGLADVRRHTTVLFESLRDDIRSVAEGVATLATRLDKRP